MGEVMDEIERYLFNITMTPITHSGWILAAMKRPLHEFIYHWADLTKYNQSWKPGVYLEVMSNRISCAWKNLCLWILWKKISDILCNNCHSFLDLVKFIEVWGEERLLQSLWSPEALIAYILLPSGSSVV